MVFDAAILNCKGYDMSNRSWATACALIALLIAAPVRAADSEGRFAIEGGGAMPCSDFLDAEKRGSSRYDYFLGWAQGYLTAANRYEAETFDLVPWQNSRILTLAIRGFCEQNMETTLFRTIDYLSLALKGQRLAQASETVTVGEGEASETLYRDVLRRAQQRLIALGHLDGKADGVWGMATRRAFEAFQKAAGADPVTGMPDQATLYMLFAAQ